ncbi:MAG: hypothetical protein IT379_00240 [Deltaproteobacteria bacterium]|nr:hypothetical protein [Deltaproteobacteria bacterium]
MSASAPRKCTSCGADAPANVLSGVVQCTYCGATFQVGAPMATPPPQQPQVVVVQVQAPPAPQHVPPPQGPPRAYGPPPAPRPYAPPPPRRYAPVPAPRKGGGCLKTIILLVILAALAVVALSCVGFFFLGTVEAPPATYDTRPSSTGF